MANPPDQMDKFMTSWSRLQKFVNVALPNLARRADAVHDKATNGRSRQVPTR